MLSNRIGKQLLIIVYMIEGKQPFIIRRLLIIVKITHQLFQFNQCQRSNDSGNLWLGIINIKFQSLLLILKTRG